MLAYLIAEPERVGESPVDATPVVGLPDCTVLARVAYEAAQQLDDEWWLPRRRLTATRAPVAA